MVDFIRHDEFWFCEFHFLWSFWLQNSNDKRHQSMLIFVDFLDVIGRFSEMNQFFLFKSGFMREKNLVKI